MYNELYHHGVKGQRWGVRRYQNKDGTVTDRGKKRLAKDLKKEYTKNKTSAQPFRTSESYKQKLSSQIDKSLTNDDKKRILDTKAKWLSKVSESDKAEEQLTKLAEKNGKKFYDDEIITPELYMDYTKNKSQVSDN